ncbi:MAG: response regulator transcription factor [Schaalia hyovaginalis]|uniref:response regulator transcription factor n=1 Tax=Schaalia hyovaginalis TaxID=29316 RepID=UPI002A7ECAA7|nr:response regulator transcription factor [Schaalia hyovaginalis]MDY4263386.1 response regulator transcription factor [Schaalia hyovaginalis]
MDDAARTTNPRALIIDDEPQILMIMRFALETAGFDIVEANDGAKAWSAFTATTFDLVLLDLMIPIIGGVSLAQRIRAVSDVPIMMITALSEESDRIRGLEAGADDYITKPFSPKELSLRAKALVRRWRGRENEVLVNGDLLVDTRENRIELAGRILEMPDTETRFVIALARHLGQPVSYRTLLNEVWATHDAAGAKDMIKMTAYRARQGLGEHGRAYIRSVRSVGYTMPRLREER